MLQLAFKSQLYKYKNWEINISGAKRLRIWSDCVVPGFSPVTVRTLTQSQKALKVPCPGKRREYSYCFVHCSYQMRRIAINAECHVLKGTDEALELQKRTASWLAKYIRTYR